MGNHLFRSGKHGRRGDRYRDAGRGGHGDDRSGFGDIAPARGPRIAGAVLLGGLIVWSLLALGLWALVDPVLAWAACMTGSATDLGVGFARWFGLGREASALRDAANVDGLVGWAIGPVHVLAKAGLILIWLAGAAALVVLPAILRRRSRW